MRYTESNAAVVNSAMIGDGVVIDATNVTLTNTESGRIFGGLVFAQGGNSFVNLTGGIIRMSDNDRPGTAVVTGSEGADTVVNGGRITGDVSLGGGTDLFTWRQGAIVTGLVDLGDGDDLFRAQDINASGEIKGGAGYDRFELVTGWSMFLTGTGFEALHFTGSGVVGGISGLQAVTYAAGARVELAHSNSPQAVVTMNGGEFQLGVDGVVGVINGTEARDAVVLSLRSKFDSALLGGGEDVLSTAARTLSQQAGSPVVSVADGGDGVDRIFLGVHDGTPDVVEQYDVDFSKFRNFEELTFGDATVQLNGAVITSDIVIVGAAAAQRFTRMVTGDRNRVEIDASNDQAAFGSATITVGDRATLVIGGDTTKRAAVGSLTTLTADSAWGNGSDDARSVTVVNNGDILGDVQFGIGDDSYDGSAGSLGGVVFGKAGNDTLVGGLGAERFEGGYGGDKLIGGGGDDMLSGGSGDDLLDGGFGADTLSGGAGSDVFRGALAELAGDVIVDFERDDVIRVIDADLGAFGFARFGDVLDFGGGQRLTVNGLSGRLEAQAAAGGGVELVLDTVRGDINGDGRADILWRNDNGALTNWLGRADGGFTGNDAAALFTGVPASLEVAGVADFNGDGRNDILWRGADGALTNWLGRADGGFLGNDAAAFGNVPTSWKVAGTGDFNGDGRDDILWRNDNGALTNWLGRADGGFLGNDDDALFASIPTSLEVAAVGDYNGDGRDDILWRGADGALTNWLGEPDGGFTGNDAAAFVYVPTSWHAQP